MVAANEFDRKVEIYEIKRNARNINLKVLKEKARTMLTTVDLFNGYDIEIKGLDMQDM